MAAVWGGGIMPEAQRFRILIVDDEKTNLDVLNHILRDDYAMSIAKSGAAALKIAKEHKPDLILLDVVMPDMNGFEVITRLKREEETQRIPIIFITGLNNAANEEKGLQLGAVDYITKPFNPAIVHTRVRTQLKILKQIRTIEELGMLDPLTELSNHKRFGIQLRVEWLRALREKASISLLLLELEHFSEYCTKYGSEQGNRLLLAVAEVLGKATKRATDLVGRLDRAQFGILLPSTDVQGSSVLAGEIRPRIASIRFAETGDHTVTASLKLLSTIPGQNDSLDDFYGEVKRKSC